MIVMVSYQCHTCGLGKLWDILAWNTAKAISSIVVCIVAGGGLITTISLETMFLVILTLGFDN
jgi:hypothetical protein